MINKDEFQLHKEIVEWLMVNGISFMNSMAIVSYSLQTDRSIAQSYIELKSDLMKVEDQEK